MKSIEDHIEFDKKKIKTQQYLQQQEDTIKRNFKNYKNMSDITQKR